MPDRSDPADTAVQCRSSGCGQNSPAPMTGRDAAGWLKEHGREAHGNPLVGGNWSRARAESPEASRARALARASQQDMTRRQGQQRQERGQQGGSR